MEQNMTLNSILSEEDNIIDVVQGGCFPWGVYCTPYCTYEFKPRQRNDETLFEIYRDIVEFFAKDKVVLVYCQYKLKKRGYKPLFKKRIHPEYVEDGKVNEFKQYLIQSNRKDLIWTDYMRYISDVINILFIPTETRDYGRSINILQEKLDFELAIKSGECYFEDDKKHIGIIIFPHSEIKHLEYDAKTIENYVNDRDTLIEVNFDENIIIEPNPKYITYPQLLETIKPIIEKHGWKLGNTENPFIKALQCNVNCLECDETECAYYLKGKNPRVDRTYYRVAVD